jgi:hypothetical protein
MNNELFIVKPSLKQYYGRTVTKDMEFDEWTDDKTIHQTLKDLVLTTYVEKEADINGIKFKEKSELTQEIPEGRILLWTEEEGYIIPNYPMYKVKDLIDEIEEIKEIYKDNTDMNPKEE